MFNKILFIVIVIASCLTPLPILKEFEMDAANPLNT